MAVRSSDELLVALGKGAYNAVLGTAESDTIDFKGQPYRLESDYQKWELAWDVGSLANGQGGVIVIGYRTEAQQNVLVETAVEHRPIPKALVNWDQHRQVLDDWITPAIDGLFPQWFPDDATVDKGVFVLVVPSQHDYSKYFVVSRMVGEDGASPKHAVGVPIRRGERNGFLPPEQIQSLVRDGLAGRRTGQAATFPPPTRDRELPEVMRSRIVDRCDEIRMVAGWEDTPFVALHAAPSFTVPRPDDFYSLDEGGLKQRLAEPRVLRRDGFNIWAYPEAEVRPDGSLFCGTERKVLWLSPDLWLSAAARADEDFLGWYHNQGRKPGEPTVLNPRVVAEYVLEFCHFVHGELLTRLDGPYTLWLSTVGFHLDGGITLVPALSPNAIYHPGRHRNQYAALQPRADVSIPLSADAGADAYDLVKELYGLFAAPPDHIPYAINRKISAQAILDGLKQK